MADANIDNSLVKVKKHAKKSKKDGKSKKHKRKHLSTSATSTSAGLPASSTSQPGPGREGPPGGPPSAPAGGRGNPDEQGPLTHQGRAFGGQGYGPGPCWQSGDASGHPTASFGCITYPGGYPTQPQQPQAPLGPAFTHGFSGQAASAPGHTASPGAAWSGFPSASQPLPASQAPSPGQQQHAQTFPTRQTAWPSGTSASTPASQMLQPYSQGAFMGHQAGHQPVPHPLQNQLPMYGQAYGPPYGAPPHHMSTSTQQGYYDVPTQYYPSPHAPYNGHAIHAPNVTSTSLQWQAPSANPLSAGYDMTPYGAIRHPSAPSNAFIDQSASLPSSQPQAPNGVGLSDSTQSSGSTVQNPSDNVINSSDSNGNTNDPSVQDDNLRDKFENHSVYSIRSEPPSQAHGSRPPPRRAASVGPGHSLNQGDFSVIDRSIMPSTSRGIPDLPGYPFSPITPPPPDEELIQLDAGDIESIVPALPGDPLDQPRGDQPSATPLQDETNSTTTSAVSVSSSTVQGQSHPRVARKDISACRPPPPPAPRPVLPPPPPPAPAQIWPPLPPPDQPTFRAPPPRPPSHHRPPRSRRDLGPSLPADQVTPQHPTIPKPEELLKALNVATSSKRRRGTSPGLVIM